jgi:hypothetical protein
MYMRGVIYLDTSSANYAAIEVMVRRNSSKSIVRNAARPMTNQAKNRLLGQHPSNQRKSIQSNHARQNKQSLLAPILASADQVRLAPTKREN